MDQLDLAYELPTGTLAAAAFSPARLLPAITGAQTDEQWRTAVADDLTETCRSAERARRLVADWSAMTGEVDDEVVSLLGMTIVHYQRPQQLQNAFAPLLDMAKPSSMSDRDPALGSATEAP